MADELEFLPAAVEVLETPPSPTGRVLAIAICAFFAIAIAWASWAEIDIVAVAERRVIPSGKTKVVQPLEIGVVKAIAVTEGQRVKAGDLLVELSRERDGASARVAEAETAIASLKQQRSQAQSEFERDRMKELTEAESKAKSLAGDLTKANRRRTLQRILSPVDGVVQQLQVHTIGGIVEPAQQLMQVVPDGAVVEIEAKILNKDIGFVHEGREAVIKMEAFPFTRYGTLDGNVTEVSDDAIEDEKLGVLFTARIAVPKAKLRVEDKILPLSPSMMASVEIKTGTRTMMEYVLSPVMKATSEAGKER